CQPKNHDYYREQNSCYDSNSIGFDQSQPQQYTVNHPIFNAHHGLLRSQKKLNITLTKVNEQMTSLTSMCELACRIVQKNLEEKQLEEEQAYGDEHLNTILATESDEFIKSCVENLVPNPSESEGENESTFDEDFLKKIYLNPLFDEEINPMKIDQHSFNAESDLKEAMPNHDSSITISSKIDSLFDEFTGELTRLKSIPSRIDETDCHYEKETRFAKRLLYNNSSPRPPEEIGLEAFQPSAECPMIINGKSIPL
nr:hypothetical protein [Tanacetum cinerariifolium]